MAQNNLARYREVVFGCFWATKYSLVISIVSQICVNVKRCSGGFIGEELRYYASGEELRCYASEEGS